MTENFSIKETFDLYKAGFEAGRKEAIAEVVDTLKFYADFSLYLGYDMADILDDFGDRADILLAKLTAECGEKE